MIGITKKEIRWEAGKVQNQIRVETGVRNDLGPECSGMWWKWRDSMKPNQ